MKTKTWFVCFYKCLYDFRSHALQSELNKVSISNIVKFRLQSMSSKIEREFEKKLTKFSIKMGSKKTSIRQCYKKCPNFGFSPNSDLCTEIVLIWYDFSYQDQH